MQRSNPELVDQLRSQMEGAGAPPGGPGAPGSGGQGDQQPPPGTS